MKYYNISFNEIYCANIRISGTNKNYNTSKRDIKINKSSKDKEFFFRETTLKLKPSDNLHIIIQVISN
ncbi:hypothetical protein PCHAJ_000490800 [Plasmodium chabaudi chabaudi]|uniref:Uncharacterized protein n=1 Tax=Plasmodium chabaudi chabaudi TaxID=31271 RepID=A0A1C6W9I1_PLACU|nr:hypothetical protein PCHAJ_000490800 [Plasmodium chabaudi chabaudi]